MGIAPTIFANVLTLESWPGCRKLQIDRAETPVMASSSRELRPEPETHCRASLRALCMGLSIGADYVQSAAQNKRKMRMTTGMTKRGARGKGRGMPPRPRGVYEPERIRAALRRFMDEHDLKPRPWAEKAGVSPGSVYQFLNIEDPDAKPSAKPKKPTEAPYISFFVLLAWAAGVTVSELIGEAIPAVQMAPAPTDSAELRERIRREIAQLGEIQEVNQRLLAQVEANEELARQNAALRREVEVLRREVSALQTKS